ncbi:MAG: hypothetical protein HKL90_11105 [Elusimicrobia bacterium]|nr:hypothetical protein [Elusimicrobiota bacterium]
MNIADIDKNRLARVTDIIGAIYVPFLNIILAAFMAVPASSADIVATKDIVSYSVTLNQIFQKFLPLGSGASTTVEFTITPTDQLKYKPKVFSLFVDDQEFDLTESFQGSGAYTVQLVEGTSCVNSLDCVELISPSTPPDGHIFSIYVKVDNAQSAAAPLTVWNIHTQTKAQPPGLSASRTNLGIGEIANLSVYPSDYIQNNQVTWGAPDTRFFSSTDGTAVTFTASKTAGSAASFTELVTAEIGSLSENLTFTVYRPTNITFSFLADTPDSTWTAATSLANAKSMGAYSTFNCRVTPTNVSFVNVFFAEEIPAASWTWPNGLSGSEQAQIFSTNGGIPPDTLFWTTNPDNSCAAPEKIRSDLWSASNLLKGTVYQDFHFDIPLSETFLDDANIWDYWFTTENHPRYFTGSTFQAHVGAIAGNTQTGGNQGPWQNTPPAGQ